ncbi:uncharacterized protein J4E88_009197 [Alternaria novae-zelandiae]|uniref:uncharacterized protein n=1 Tax=Alternaria novae-zelandiae TaxID=430562 RepID=UPI0020C2A6C0|nr:uncharacterized protein J4E88_009197 [Alternaria novae-zelandiae]KAI4671164.1 hypothetical protein J4E88_009197 [Alternaria novae-zelandiae]
MTNEPQNNQLDIEESTALKNREKADDITKRARNLTERRMAKYITILNRYDKKEERPRLRYPGRSRLLEESICLKVWGRDTGLYQYNGNKNCTPKHDFRNLPSVAKSSITDSLKEMGDILGYMHGDVSKKKMSWAEEHHKLMSPDSDDRDRLDRHVDDLRNIIVYLELSVDPDDESNTWRGEASPSFKTLFRRCATEYTTTFKRIDKGSSSLSDKLPSGHIEGPRNEFIRWGREAGVLRGGRKSLEAKIVESDKSESRDQIVKIVLCIESALGAISELLPEKHVSGGDLTTADADNNSNLTLSLTERAKGLIEQMAMLRQYNESLTRETENLVRR